MVKRKDTMERRTETDGCLYQYMSGEENSLAPSKTASDVFNALQDRITLNGCRTLNRARGTSRPASILDSLAL